MVHQQFSFSGPMFSYIRTECSSSVYSKLIQTCKYFFSKYSMILVKYVTFNSDSIEMTDMKGSKNNKITIPLNKLFFKLGITCGFNFPDPLADCSLFIPLIYKFDDANFNFYKQYLYISTEKIVFTKKWFILVNVKVLHLILLIVCCFNTSFLQFM